MVVHWRTFLRPGWDGSHTDIGTSKGLTMDGSVLPGIVEMFQRRKNCLNEYLERERLEFETIVVVSNGEICLFTLPFLRFM